MKNVLYLYTIMVLLALSSCVKPPEYPIEPEIEFLNLDINEIPQDKGVIESFVWATISFRDGDGDIGEGGDTPGKFIFLKDLRDGSTPDVFGIPEVPALGSNNGISGEISFKIRSSCCQYPDFITDAIDCEASIQYPIDTVIYEVYIEDRAGNRSNTVELAPIYLACDEEA